MRPKLVKNMSIKDFKDNYFEKQELLTFCKKCCIATSGSKSEITKRIIYFLDTGKIKQMKKKALKGPADSSCGITVTTPVVKYKSDQKTRDFFLNEIGDTFKFNHYLREFAKGESDRGITYGDLVDGYKKSLKDKKKTIDKQFEYNQFMRDFFEGEKGKIKKDCISAWKLVKNTPGPSTYKCYLEIK